MQHINLDSRDLCGNPKQCQNTSVFVPTQKVDFNNSKLKYTRYLSSNLRLYFHVHVSYKDAKLSIDRSKGTKVIV